MLWKTTCRIYCEKGERALLVPICLFHPRSGWRGSRLRRWRVKAKLFELLPLRKTLTKIDRKMVRVASIMNRSVQQGSHSLWHHWDRTSHLDWQYSQALYWVDPHSLEGRLSFVYRGLFSECSCLGLGLGLAPRTAGYLLLEGSSLPLQSWKSHPLHKWRSYQLCLELLTE